MRNNYVENSGSDHKGAVGYSIMFAAYLLALTILALCSVSPWYFFAVLLVGFPVSGLFLSGIAGMKARKEAIADQVHYNPEPAGGRHVETTNDDGLPILKL